ncbi:MAG: SsrA-binding protein SmpB [Bdellovibrio sp.]|nr:SsrA-binding protein SmpB [Bdellovibrio sp.]
MSEEKLLAKNPNAYANYYLEELIEAGVVLTGTEIKSLRNQAPSLRDSFVDVVSRKKRIEAWLLNAHIAPYSHGNIWNHDPKRKRKLLLHKRELEKLFGSVTQQGKTVVPTKMYLKKGFAKIEIAIAKGKKKHDKRETIKKRETEREMSRALKRSI